MTDVDKASPEARARLRGLEIIEEDLRKGKGAYNLEQACLALNGISRQAFHEKIEKDQILTIPGSGNQRCYPAFQFVDGDVLPGLDRVLSAVPSQDPWFRLHWLVNPDSRLGGYSPTDLLIAGKVDLVEAAARRIGEMGP